jgi:hypothetical protein
MARRRLPTAREPKSGRKQENEDDPTWGRFYETFSAGTYGRKMVQYELMFALSALAKKFGTKWSYTDLSRHFRR